MLVRSTTIFKIILLLIMPLANFSQTDKPLFAGGIFIMENQNEVWKDVVGYEGSYQISDFGNVRSLDRKIKHLKEEKTKSIKGKLLKGILDVNGYVYVFFKKSKCYKIHRLVAIHFIPNPENKPQVNHINGIHNDNRLENLEWVTNGENQIHSYRVLGKKSNVLKGSSSNFSKLSENNVLEIRQLYDEKLFSRKELSVKFNVTKSNIDQIVTRKSWKHLC